MCNSLPLIFVHCFVWHVHVCACLYMWISACECTIACIWWSVDNLDCGPCLPPCLRQSTLFLLCMLGYLWVCRKFPVSTFHLTMENYYRCMLPCPALCGYWGLNLMPPVCTKSIFSTQPCFQSILSTFESRLVQCM